MLLFVPYSTISFQHSFVISGITNNLWTMTDIAIIGAGMAGLLCAQQLKQAGYSVLVVEKSRGYGGRVATRRVDDTRADHGASYVKSEGEMLSQLVKLLCDRHIMEVWTDEVYQLTSKQLSISDATPHYTAPTGMNAIGKFLAQDLEVLLSQRVICVTQTTDNWSLTTSENEVITAKALVLAIPAPQALMLLEPMGTSILGNVFLDKLRDVQFYPTITVMAGYPATSSPLPQWKAVDFSHDKILRWVGFDSSKRPHTQQPHFVIHASADFAQLHLESDDLQPISKQMLQHAAVSLQLPWLDTPQWMQVHRWRYAFPRTPLQSACLSAKTSIPLVCCGDWCGGNLIESAMVSGLAAAQNINTQLQQLTLPGISFYQGM